MILKKEHKNKEKEMNIINYASNYLKAAKESIDASEILLKADHEYEAFTLASRALKLAIEYFCVINKIKFDKKLDCLENLEAIYYSKKKLPLTDYVKEELGKFMTSLDYPMYGRLNYIDVKEAIKEAKISVLNIEEECNKVLNKEEK